jgi:hypothetical protein
MNLFDKDDLTSVSVCASEYKLLPWIEAEKLDWFYLCQNPNALHLIEEVNEKPGKGPKIKYNSYTHGPLDYHYGQIRLQYIEDNYDDVSISTLFSSHDASHLIEEKLKENNPDISPYLYILYENPGAIGIIEKLITNSIPTSSQWSSLCRNPKALHIIEKKMNDEKEDFMHFSDICKNIGAIKLLEKLYKGELGQYIDHAFLALNPSTFEIEGINKGVYNILTSL